MYDTIIIGSGPAGISASVYAKRYNLDFFVMEKNYIAGGKILYPHWIENYIGFPKGISGSSLADLFVEHEDLLGVKKIIAECVRIKKFGSYFETIDQKKNIYQSKTIILAQGTVERTLDIPGEEKYRGKGVSYCATCDAPFFKKKTIATIGGGDSALSETIYLSEFADLVYLIHRRDTLRGAEMLADQISNNQKIKTFLGYEPIEINGDDFVQNIIIRNNITKEETSLTVDGIFIFAGYEPKTDFIIDTILLDDKGFIITNEEMQTSVPGLYAAGDIRSKPLRQIITAVSDGAVAAHSIRELIKG